MRTEHIRNITGQHAVRGLLVFCDYSFTDKHRFEMRIGVL